MAAAPPPTKEQLGAALQQAGQYAGGSTVLTPENAQDVGLDPARGYVAKGTSTDVPVNPAPAIPSPLPGPAPTADTPAPTADTSKADPAYPGAIPYEGDPKLVAQAKAFKKQQQLGQPAGSQPGTTQPKEIGEVKPDPRYPGAVPYEEPKQKDDTSSAYPGAIPYEEPKQPQPPQPVPQPTAPVTATPQPAPAPTPQQPAPPAQPQLPTPMPSGTGAGAPQGPAADPHSQIAALIAQGKTPGEAQAAVAGQEPKTLAGQTPKPVEPKPEQPAQPEGEIVNWKDHGFQSFEQYQAFLDASGSGKAVRGPGTTATLVRATTATEPPKIQLPAPSGQDETPTTINGNRLYGTSTIFGLNYDGSPDPDDNGRGFFGGVNTRNPNLRAVAVPVDVLEGIFGKFTQKNAQGGYDALNTPEAKAIMAKIRSAHVELPDANGKMHKFPIVDIQGSLGGHPGKVLDMTLGATKEMGFKDNHAVSYQIIGGDGKPYPIPEIELTGSGKGGAKEVAPAGGSAGWTPLAGQPLFSIPTTGGGGGGAKSSEPSQNFGGGGDGGGGGRQERGAGPSDVGSINLGGGVLFANALRGGGGGAAAQPQQRPQQEEEPVSSLSALANMYGGAPTGGQAPMKQANVLGVTTVGGPPPAPGVPALPSPQAQLGAPAKAPPAAPDPTVIQGLMKRGFTRQQAIDFAAKASVSKPGAPAKAPPPSAPSATLSTGIISQAQRSPPPAKQPPPTAQAPPPSRYTGAPRGSTFAVPHPLGSEALKGLPLAQALKQHAALLSPDDPRVKKQKDNMTKGEHFVGGDPVHEELLNGLPYGKQGRQGQILAQAEQAIGEKQPMHLSYISAPKEAALHPTRESRTIQYEEHSPEARLMGTTEGQLVGHSMIPVSVGISPSRKSGEPHQGYIQGISTNVLANNFAHVVKKLAEMGQKSPYEKLGAKFTNDLEGYLSNLNAGHTGTGRDHAVGTAEHPNTPDENHVPYHLTRREADFLNTVINNTAAFAKHEDGQALRRLAEANGTLITPEGETNRMRHQMEEHEPGWRSKVLEPSIRTFKTGLIHEVHPNEEHMPASVRPGKEYQDLTKAIQRTSERGRPDVPVSVSPRSQPTTSMPRDLAQNRLINEIERHFSDDKITEEEARHRLRLIGENPNEYRFVGGSGGLITPYEDDPEAITHEEHASMKDNLRKQWVGGKLNVEDYRRKVAEVPLPSKPSPKPVATSPAAPVETPETPAPAPKPVPQVPKPKPMPKPAPEPAEEPEPEETEPPKRAPAPDEPLPEPVKKPSASHYVSPSVKEGTDLAGALKQVQSQPHKKARDFYQKVEDAYRPGGGGTVTPTIGNWEGTKEGSSWTHDDKDSLQDARVKAGVKGLHSAQKGTAAFHYHGEGPDRHYDIDFPEHSHEEADKLIAKHGFPASTIHKTPEGLRAHLIDPGGENYDHALQLAAEAKAKSPIARRGTAAFDGGDDRESAAEAYRRILGESGIQIRGGQGGLSLRGYGAKGQHPLQPLYEEAEDSFAQHQKGIARQAENPPGKAPTVAPAPGDVLPPVKKTAEPQEKLTKPPWEQADEQTRQDYLEKRVSQAVAGQSKDPRALKLKALRNEQGGVQYDPQGNPVWEKTDYDIANLPMLGKKGVNQIKGADEHEDTLGKDEHLHLNQVERRRLSAMRTASSVKTLGDHIADSYNSIKDIPEIAAGKGWYSRMRDKMARAFGVGEGGKASEDHETFAQLLGATSAKTPVRTNFIQALDAFERYKEGRADPTNMNAGWNRHIAKYLEAYDKMHEGKGALLEHMKSLGIHDPEDQTDADAMASWIKHHNILPLQRNGAKYNSNSNAVLKVLAGKWLKEVGAPKTPNFAGNLTGRTLAATIDVWAARHLHRIGTEDYTKGRWRPQSSAEPGVNSLDFAYSQDAMKHAADKIGINPDDLQAILWYAEKHHYEKSGWTRGQGAEKSSFDDVFDKVFENPSGRRMTAAEAQAHYQAVSKAESARKTKIKTAKTQAARGDPKLAAYMEKHGLTHEEVHGADEDEEAA